MGRRRRIPHVPLKLIKPALIEDFDKWCNERDVDQSNENMIEFLLQKNFIQGKPFRDYIDGIPVTWERFMEIREPLQEGFYPPNTMI